MQRVPRVSADDVERIIRRDFPAASVARIYGLLDAYDPATEEGRARVQLAILKLADGDPAELETYIAEAKRDPRDVLSLAEYPQATQQSSRVEMLADSDRQRLYDADWMQYERWLNDERDTRTAY